MRIILTKINSNVLEQQPTVVVIKINYKKKLRTCFRCIG